MNIEMLMALLGEGILLLLLGAFIFGNSFKRPEAKRHAAELLRAVLTPEQHSQLTQQGHIDIPSPSNPERIYRVPKYPGRVQVREKGRVTMWLCLQPYDWVPDADVVAIHKLMIEADEETYLQKANQIAPFSFEYNVARW
jgi:hypothetical protein